MLLGNYSNLNSNPGKNIGGFTNPYGWMKVSNAMSFYIGNHVVTDVTNRASLHNGYISPYVLVLAPKVGGMSLNGVSGYGSINGANLAGGILLSADLTGVGTINSATGSLLAFATAVLSGIGDLSADIIGRIEMVSSLSGSGDLAGALGALSGAVCAIIGTGNLSGDIVGTLNASADLSGVGVLLAAGTALLELQASLSGVGTISGDIGAAANASATLAGSGDITGAIQALATITSSLQGTGSFNIVTSTSPGYMSADISLATALSPESLAAAVWNAVAASYNSSGTMGEKMNDAGSASNPWTEVIEGSYTAADLLRLLTAVAAGKSIIVDNGDGTKTVTFRDVNDTRNTVEAEIENSERTSVILDLS